MDAEPRDEITDAALDRDLRSLLAVDPSPEFTARVRARIASEPDRSPWRSTWTFAAGAVAVAAVALVAIVAPRTVPHRDRADVPRTSSRPLVSGGQAAEDARVPNPASGLDARTSAGRAAGSPNAAAAVRQAPARSAAPREPEVLVDAREAAALRAFFERARRGGVDLTAIAAPAATQPADLNLLHDIDITPIAFESVIGTDGKGVRQ